jgi:hypothetical protein
MLPHKKSYTIFSIFVYKRKTKSKQLKQKELKRQKQEKEKRFANLKTNRLTVVQPPKLRKLHGTRE